MPPKRINEGGDSQPIKRARPGQARDYAPKTASVPHEKATRSTNMNSDGGTQMMRPSPPPEFQLRPIPPLTKPTGFPCFSDGDVLVILDHGDLNHQFRLHSQVLRNLSVVFDELLSTKFPEKIPKRILNTNKTGLLFCLELKKDPSSNWCLQKGSLYVNVALDNSNPVPATERQMKDYGKVFGSDGSSEDTPTSPTDRLPPLSPSRKPAVYSDGENAPRGPRRDIFPSSLKPPQKSTLGEYLGSSPTRDVNVDMSSALGDSEELGSAMTEAVGESSSITGVNVLSHGAPPTPTYESETSMAEMSQSTRPEQISGAISAAMEGFPKEDACDSITSSRTATLDNKTPSTPTSDWESSLPTAMAETGEKTSEGSKMRTPVNMPDIGTRTRGVADIYIPILNFQRANPAIRIGDKGEKTCLMRASIDQILVKGSQDDECQVISVNQKSQSPLAPPVKRIAKSRLAQLRAISAFSSLLRVAYYMPPMVSQKDIRLALIQSENLIEVAKLYQKLPAISAHVSHLLTQHGRQLFQSVALEPVRWLNLSIDLKNKIIFQEAMIHLVGRIEDKFTPESFPGVPGGVVKLVQRKSREMDDEISRVNGLLAAISIYELGVRASLTDISSFDSWVLASFWREWFAINIKEAQSRTRHPEEPTIQAKLGSLYRTIFAGGDAYLPKQEVLDVLRPLQHDGTDQIEGFLQWDSAIFDLTLMKKYASKTVQNLCYNRSQLDPSVAGLTYLTCTHIGDHEFPWVSAPRN